MALLQKLRISKINKTLEASIKEGVSAIKSTEKIKKSFIEPFDDAYDGNTIKKIIKEEYFIMCELKSKNPELFSKAKKLYVLLNKLSTDTEYISAKNHSESLMGLIDCFEGFMVKEEHEILDEFNNLLIKHDLNEDDILDFTEEHSNFFKIKTNKKLRKIMQKVLKYHIEEEKFLEPGPTMSTKELGKLKSNLANYFGSDYFLKLIRTFELKQISVNVSIYGSLVTGFASQYSKFKGLPSDYKRVSDVDLGIVIDNHAIKKISINGRCLFKKGVYYGPFHEHNAEKLGPFMRIFSFVDKISFAKKTNRKIGFIVVNKGFYESNLANDKHKELFNKTIILN